MLERVASSTDRRSARSRWWSGGDAGITLRDMELARISCRGVNPIGVAVRGGAPKLPTRSKASCIRYAVDTGNSYLVQILMEYIPGTIDLHIYSYSYYHTTSSL